MTLLESLLALVILGLSAVGYLEVFQGSTRSVMAADEWERAAAVAEATMEGELLRRREGTGVSRPELPDGFGARVETSPWRGHVTDVAVTVTLPDGRSYTVHRLVRE
jgi:type II secretory pathway pseudopilin PulG